MSALTAVGALVVCLGLVGTHGEPQTLDEVFMKVNTASIQSRLGSDKVIDGIDMVLTKEQYQLLYKGKHGKAYNASATLINTWTDGIIPFELAYGHFNDERASKIQEAMDTWQNLTCVRFRPATPGDQHKITLFSGQGCWSQLGMSPQPQLLSLQFMGCFWRGTVEHELGHAIGLVHEHQRPERDYYIAVNEYNVLPAFRSQLNVYDNVMGNKLGLAYDYYSVMHYGQYAFSANQQQTLFAVDRQLNQRRPDITKYLGRVLGPSFTDVKLVNWMYNCNASCDPMPTCAEECFVDKHCQCVCQDDLPNVPCVDHLKDCTERARQGQCSQDLANMEFFCRRTCGMCPTQGSRLPLDRPPKPIVDVVCEDKRSDCQSLVDRGDCRTNPEPMLMECAKACGFCTESQRSSHNHERCGDASKSCVRWAQNGDCETNPGHMHRVCPKSCGLC
ncbi:zinc metalloproteinase nas-6-like [Babylonia areolata]|uniref:zinc metalloproteinase nas-6-like n=1 Tax=Babylonia areolata TaxID=304850 RepID=UPI003FD5AEF2